MKGRGTLLCVFFPLPFILLLRHQKLIAHEVDFSPPLTPKNNTFQGILKTDVLLDRFVVVPEYKLLFCYTEKTGCSMFNHLFRMLRLLHPSILNKSDEVLHQVQQLWFRNTPKHHNINKAGLDTLFKDPEWTKAAFFRNPLERFASAHQSKCAGMDEDGGRRCRVAFGSPNISFREAILALQSPQSRARAFSEPHFMPTSYFCGGLARSLQHYDFVHELRKEDATDKVLKLFGMIGVPSNVSKPLAENVATRGTNLANDENMIQRFHNSTIHFREEKKLTPGHLSNSSDMGRYFRGEETLVDIIKDAYAIDYATFYEHNVAKPECHPLPDNFSRHAIGSARIESNIPSREKGSSLMVQKKSKGNKKCVVHIHGLHHSGTGYLRQRTYDALGGKEQATLHLGTGKPQDEGQHLQSIFPPFKKRLFMKICGNGTIWDAYNCPQLLLLAKNDSNKLKVFEEWSQFWDMTKPFLIQKTPTLDVAFLEQMKIHPTVHVLSIRHPLSWYPPVRFHGAGDAFSLLLSWTNVWATVLGQLRHAVRSFVVVNYEALVGDEDKHVIETAARLIQDFCSIEEKEKRQTWRRLELHSGVNSSTYSSLSSKQRTIWDSCENNSLCRSLMGDLSDIMSKFGYSWDRDSIYDPGKINRHNTVLYSSHVPPEEEIVLMLQHISKKYRST